MKKEKEQSTIISLIELFAIVAAIIVILVFLKNTVIWNIVVLLLMLTLLVFVHEFGHFIVAKKCGVHVYEFAVGMGPKILGFKRKNDPTEYSLRCLPIGGYCQMAGEEGEDDEKLAKDKFMCNKSKIKRTLILIAGVTMNFITAIIILFILSITFGTTEQSSIVGRVEENSPAYDAGIKVGDKIVGCNGYKISSWDKLSIVTNLKNKSKTYEYTILHADGKEEKVKITPATYVNVNGELIRVTDELTKEDIMDQYNIKEDELVTQELIGIGAPSEVIRSFSNAIKYAFFKFGSIVSTMLMIIWSLITGKLGLSALSGPVGMYTIVGESAKYGLANIVYLTAYLSVNLGVINILPFPAFDGGRVLFVIIEAITKKKVDAKVEGWFHTIGFILIILLMIYITFQDILRLF